MESCLGACLGAACVSEPCIPQTTSQLMPQWGSAAAARGRFQDEGSPERARSDPGVDTGLGLARAVTKEYACQDTA